MVAVDIWVEGIADRKFLSDVMEDWFQLTFQKFDCRDYHKGIHVRIKEGKGVGTFTSPAGWVQAKPFFEENIANGVKNIIIIDADEDFESRMKEVTETISGVDFNVERDLFLWPDHQPHSEKGDLECLLEQIIQPEHHVIFDCWSKYEDCLKLASGKNYTTPARKTKIYAYLEALLGKTQSEKDKIKERNREYLNREHWNLDGEKPPLKNLKVFLGSHLFPVQTV